MECHLNLLTWKFLDWRTKLYIEMSRIYEEMRCMTSAKRIINKGLKKIKQIVEYE